MTDSGCSMTFLSPCLECCKTAAAALVRPAAAPAAKTPSYAGAVLVAALFVAAVGTVVAAALRREAADPLKPEAGQAAPLV